MTKKRRTVGIRHANKQKIDALKSEAARLAGPLLGEEKNISRLQCMQSEIAGKMARAASRKVENPKSHRSAS